METIKARLTAAGIKWVEGINGLRGEGWYLRETFSRKVKGERVFCVGIARATIGHRLTYTHDAYNAADIIIGV
jgi:hypothetical protein